jgi:hypothetical protein
MAFVNADGSELINGGPNAPLPTLQVLPNNTKMGFGAIVTRRRVLGEFLISQASNAAAATDYFSQPIYVVPFTEILLFATFTAASTGTPAGLELCLQVSDGTANFSGVTLANTFIDHPSGKVTVASPGNGPGPVAVGQWTNFGTLVRARIRWSTAWSSAQAIQVMLKAKG